MNDGCVHLQDGYCKAEKKDCYYAAYGEVEDCCSYKPNNANKLREMSIGEFAHFIYELAFNMCEMTLGYGYSVGDEVCTADCGGDAENECLLCLEEWLKGEAKMTDE